MPPSVPPAATDLAPRAAGRVLAAATAAVDAARRARKPLHPRGRVHRAALVRHGDAEARSGVDWLDSPGRDDALVRVSAAVGLPPGWPDVQGLAIRVLLADGPADVLLATTGERSWRRFLLTPTRTVHGHVHTSLLPYSGPHGPLLLGARATGPDTWRLAWATPLGPWRVFATLSLREETDQEPSYDAVLNAVPGLRTYGWVARLRLPAYRTARRRRGEDR